MEWTNEPDDTSFSSEVDHWRVENLFEELFEEPSGTEVATTEQEPMQNLGQPDNQNLSMQPGTSRQTQTDRSNLPVFSCDVCTYQTQNMSDYIEHKQTHEDSRNFVCPICNRVFRNRASFVKHMDLWHKFPNQPPDSTLRCDQCAFSTNRKDILEKHKTTHSDKSKYQCSICGGKFKTEINLNSHYRNVHKQPIDNTYCCDQCDFTDIGKGHLKRHKKSHSDKSDHQCKICGGKFKTKNILSSHYSNVHNQSTDKIYHCDQCDFAASTQDQINEHKKTHVDFPDFQCDICGGKFGTRQLLTIHYKHVHNKSTEGIYRCDQCAFSTNYKKNLKNHKKAHVDFPDYLCDICGGKFRTRRLLNTHYKLVHKQSTDGKHRCNQCPYMTNNHANLIKHKRKLHGTTHAEISGFQSSTRGERSTEQVDLRRRIFPTTSHSSDTRRPSNVVPQDLRTPQAHDFLYCGFCNKCFKTIQGYNKHNIMKHSHLTCRTCFQRFTTTDRLIAHERNHDEQHMHTCHICQNQYETLESLHTHLREHRNTLHKCSDPKFYCKLCKLYFQTENELNEHNKIHSHVCHICSQVFQTRRSLNLHMPIHNETSFVCSHCDEELRTREELHAHEQTHLDMPLLRSEAELSECHLCGMQCETPEDLNLHIKNNCDGNLPINQPETQDVSRFEEINQPGPSGYRHPKSPKVSGKEGVNFPTVHKTRKRDSLAQSGNDTLSVKRPKMQDVSTFEETNQPGPSGYQSPKSSKVSGKEGVNFPTVHKTRKRDSLAQSGNDTLSVKRPKMQDVSTFEETNQPGPSRYRPPGSLVASHKDIVQNLPTGGATRETESPGGSDKFSSVGSPETPDTDLNKLFSQLPESLMAPQRDTVENLPTSPQTEERDNPNESDNNIQSVNRPAMQDVSRFEETNQPGPSGYRHPKSSKASGKEGVNFPTVHKSRKRDSLAQSGNNTSSVKRPKMQDVSTFEESNQPGPSGYRPPGSLVASHKDIVENLPKGGATRETESPVESDKFSSVGSPETPDTDLNKLFGHFLESVMAPQEDTVENLPTSPQTEERDSPDESDNNIQSVNRTSLQNIERSEESGQPGTSRYQCRICQIYFSDYDDFIEHMFRHCS